MKLPLLPLAAGLGLAATAGHAATITYSDSVALQETDWAETLSISQFDTGLGLLTGVSVTLSGTVTGDAFAENMSGNAATILLDLSSMISASTTSLEDFASILPLASTVFVATAFDGLVDLVPGSGTTVSGLTAMDTITSTLTGADMAEFVGGGFVDINLTAKGASEASGAGNVISGFTNFASATLQVTYTYDEVAPVPLPAGGALLLTALGAVAVSRRKQG